MVGDTYPPATKDVPTWGLRAEYWVEGAGDNYGTDTTATGSYLRLTTDQVRFYRADAADNHAHAAGGGYTAGRYTAGRATPATPLTVDRVPPRAFSEVMRDVDLFVGVASVGNTGRPTCGRRATTKPRRGRPLGVFPRSNAIDGCPDR